MTARIRDSDVQQYVERLMPFSGATLYTQINRLGYYVVYIRNYYYPIGVAVPQNGGQALWFANQSERATSAAYYLAQFLPDGGDITWLNTYQIECLAHKGYDALVRKHLSIPL